MAFQYPGSAALALNNLTSLAGSDDEDKPKKPALYRAGQAVGTGLNAAHQVASTVDQAVDQGIASGVNATKLGISNFVRGVQGQPSLSSLPQTPAAASDPSAPAAAAPVLTRPSGADQTADWWSRVGAGANASSAGTVPNGSLPVAPVLKPAIDSGVTLPDGRKLAYGAMVNGVPTFSDGTGGVGAPPATMTKADIANLGNRLSIVPSTAFTQAAPAFNSDNSDANVGAILRSRQGGVFGITPEQNAAADLAAVANQDPRSTLGRAALNASRSANAASTTLQRKQALAGLGSLQDAVAKNATLGIDNAGALQRANAETQATLQRQTLANQGDLARQDLANQGDLERTDLAGKYGIAAALANPKKTGEMTSADYLKQIGTGVQAQVKAYNDQQALLPTDQRQPLTDDAIAEMRAIQAKALGLQTATNPKTGARMMNINGQWTAL